MDLRDSTFTSNRGGPTVWAIFKTATFRRLTFRDNTGGSLYSGADMNVFGALATWRSAGCPALGTDEGWGERADHGDCGFAATCAGLSLPCLLLLLWEVRNELVAMGRAAQ